MIIKPPAGHRERTMITEALIVAVGGLFSILLFRIKEIYEIWVNFTVSLRKDEAVHESTVIAELKAHINRLTLESDSLRASIAFLTHEQLECSVEEERLWGALNLIHHHVVKQNEEMKQLGASPDETPPLPPRRIRSKMTPEEFFRRSAQTTVRLEEAAAAASNSRTGITQSGPPPSPPAPGGKS